MAQGNQHITTTTTATTVGAGSPAPGIAAPHLYRLGSDAGVSTDIDVERLERHPERAEY